MKRKFIVSDIHGCYDTFLKLIDSLPLKSLDELVIAGDLVDRGPKSRDVINYIRDNKIDCVKGNHEDMMSDITKYPWGIWELNGGDITLDNYKDDRDSLKADKKWVGDLPLFLSFPDVVNDKGDHLLVSHSMCSQAFNGSFRESIEDEIMWCRDFYDIAPIEGKYNVFGHTPQSWGPKIESFYACIDTGCFYKGEEGYGELTALEFPSMKVYKQINVD